MSFEIPDPMPWPAGLSFNEAWLSIFNGTGTFNEQAFEWLGSQGFSGTLSERWSQYAAGGAAPSGRILTVGNINFGNNPSTGYFKGDAGDLTDPFLGDYAGFTDAEIILCGGDGDSFGSQMTFRLAFTTRPNPRPLGTMSVGPYKDVTLRTGSGTGTAQSYTAQNFSLGVEIATWLNGQVGNEVPVELNLIAPISVNPVRDLDRTVLTAGQGSVRVGYRRGSYGSLDNANPRVRAFDWRPSNNRVALIVDGTVNEDAFTTIVVNGVTLNRADATFQQLATRARWRWTADLNLTVGQSYQIEAFS